MDGWMDAHIDIQYTNIDLHVYTKHADILHAHHNTPSFRLLKPEMNGNGFSQLGSAHRVSELKFWPHASPAWAKAS